MQLGPQADSQKQANLADLWWDCGELTKSAADRQSCWARSLYWYLLAYERPPDSLDRIHVKKRIEESASGEGENLLALCSQLAREMSVKLSNSRVQITSHLRMQEAVSDDRLSACAISMDARPTDDFCTREPAGSAMLLCNKNLPLEPPQNTVG